MSTCCWVANGPSDFLATLPGVNSETAKTTREATSMVSTIMTRRRTRKVTMDQADIRFEVGAADRIKKDGRSGGMSPVAHRGHERDGTAGIRRWSPRTHWRRCTGRDGA